MTDRPYPLVDEALKGVQVSAGVAGYKAAARTADILWSMLECSPQEKEPLMTAAILSYDSQGGAEKAQKFGEYVVSLMQGVRLGPSQALCPTLRRSVLRICAAARVAEYDHLRRVLPAYENSPDALWRIKETFVSARGFLLAKGCMDLDAPRLEQAEESAYTRTLRDIHARFRASTGHRKGGFLRLRTARTESESSSAF